MSIQTANGPSFVGCKKIACLIEEGPHAVEQWLDGDDSEMALPCDYNGWSGIAFQLAHYAQRSSDRTDAIAFGRLACRVYEEILPDFQSELTCVGLGCGGALTKVEGMQLRVRLIARYGHSDDEQILDPTVVATWFDACEDRLDEIRELSRRDLSEMSVEEIARLRFARNRIGILRALPAEAIAPELDPWIELYDALP